MKIPTAAKFPLPLLILIAACCTAFTASAADEIETHDLEGISRVDFYISKANIVLVGSDRSNLELTLEKPSSGFEADKLSKSIERSGDTLVIEIEYETSKKSWSIFSSDSKGYKQATLELPAHIETRIKTSGGNILAENLAAPTELDTSGGNISASKINAPVDIRTSGGNIQLREINGDTEAKTSGGNISVKGLAGSASLRTSGGNIHIEGEIPALEAKTSGGHIEANLHAQVVEPLDLKTSGGNVSATLDQGTLAPIKLKTSGGNVSIALPESQAFKLDAKSNGGNVSLDHSGAFDGTLKPKSVKGTVNGDGPEIELSSNGGRVRIGQI